MIEIKQKTSSFILPQIKFNASNIFRVFGTIKDLENQNLNLIVYKTFQRSLGSLVWTHMQEE